jgi:hypothetical protein
MKNNKKTTKINETQETLKKIGNPIFFSEKHYVFLGCPAGETLKK